MKTYLFNASVERHASGQIFSADNGEGYVSSDELHIVQDRYHFVYKFGGEQVGWYMHNSATKEDIFLGDGASPSAEYGDLSFEDEEYFKAITRSMDDEALEVEEVAE